MVWLKKNKQNIVQLWTSFCLVANLVAHATHIMLCKKDPSQLWNCSLKWLRLTKNREKCRPTYVHTTKYGIADIKSSNVTNVRKTLNLFLHNCIQQHSHGRNFLPSNTQIYNTPLSRVLPSRSIYHHWLWRTVHFARSTFFNISIKKKSIKFITRSKLHTHIALARLMHTHRCEH